MGATQDRVLSARDAACILYNTADPSEDQVNKVRAKLARGDLRASGKRRWTTTQEGIAEHLAAQAIGQTRARQCAAAVRRSNGDNGLSSYYRELIKDYFFAVALRRRIAYRSRSFHRAAVSGQVLLLLAGLLLVFQCYNAVDRATTTPDQQAVLGWLDANVEKYKAVEWLPVVHVAEGVKVRVHYKYFENGKGIRTLRAFIVRDGRVTDSDADDD